MAAHILRSFFTLFLTCLLYGVSLAAGVSGRINDASGHPISFANVVLLRVADSALIKTELTDEKGEFLLTPIADGSYFVKVVLMGYNDYKSSTFSVSGSDINMPPITLTAKVANLSEVAIRAQKPFVEVHADKLVVNVENSIVSSGSTALEVLARAPGVAVDNNDNISLKGKPGVTVMINGKIQPISGQDQANMLKSMPSNAIETIELISNPSAKYDAAGTAGIINLKLKKDKKIGLNGSLTGTYAQGVYGKTNWGGNMNYRNKKLNLFANYNGSYREGFNHLTLDRNFYEGSQFVSAYVQDNQYLYKIGNHSGSAGIDYNLSSKTVLGASVSGDMTDFLRTGNNYSIVVDTGQYNRHFITTNSAPNVWGSKVANMNLRHSFDSNGRSLSADVDYAAYPNRGVQDFTTTYYNDVPTDSRPIPDSNIFTGNLKGLTQIRSVKVDYSMPLPRSVNMDAGIKSSYVTSDNDLQFFNINDGVKTADTGRTFNFAYRENINAGYLNFNKEFTKWGTQLGLRIEQTIAGGDAVELTKSTSFTRNYTQFFPSFAVQRHVDKKNDLGMTLSRRIERPNYDQLNPSTYYLDPTTYKTGYPYLNPALAYSAELSWVHDRKFITNLNYTITSNPIVEVIQPSDSQKKITIQTQKNLTSLAYYGINGSYQIRFFSWWNNTTNANVFYSHYTGDIAGTNLNAGRVAFDVNTTNSFMLPHDWSAEVGGYYQAPSIYGYMHLKVLWMLNLGIQKNLFDRRATARIGATDIFWHGYPRATSIYDNYIESFVAKRDTRQVTMSFTYRFGKRTVPPTQRHRGGAEDEKNRARSATG